MLEDRSIGRKVFVGLSGGVDSSVSAALLKKAGFDVTGVFIKVWQPDWIECTWKEEKREAMRAAAHLGIKFETLDLSKEYKKDVIDYMIKEYSLGRTPNPDVMCNRSVKFGAFWKWAKENGADYIATGHYVQIRKSSLRNIVPELKSNSEIQSSMAAKDERDIGFSMLAGVDKEKDQSYFLWTLNQNDLPHVMFPVGGLIKPEVRRLAKKFGLPNAEKKDSQGLCFIGKVDVKEFLAHYINNEPGNVLNENGEVIGRHPGALFFTKGERHGFILDKKTPHDAPYYVIDKDVEQNTLMVSNRDINRILPGAEKRVTIRNVNWVKGEVPIIRGHTSAYPFQARGRYRQPLQNIRIVDVNFSETVIEFEMPQDTLSAGQSLVIYDGEECLGGGVIE